MFCFADVYYFSLNDAQFPSLTVSFCRFDVTADTLVLGCVHCWDSALESVLREERLRCQGGWYN